jgi:hypothetical protein
MKYLYILVGAVLLFVVGGIFYSIGYRLGYSAPSGRKDLSRESPPEQRTKIDEEKDYFDPVVHQKIQEYKQEIERLEKEKRALEEDLISERLQKDKAIFRAEKMVEFIKKNFPEVAVKMMEFMKPKSLSPEEIAKRITEIRHEIDKAWQDKDGNRLLGLLRELLNLGEPAYESALELAMKIEEDMRGNKQLDIGDLEFGLVTFSEPFISMAKNVVISDRYKAEQRVFAGIYLALMRGDEAKDIFLDLFASDRDLELIHGLIRASRLIPKIDDQISLLEKGLENPERENRIRIVRALRGLALSGKQRAINILRNISMTESDPEIREIAQSYLKGIQFEGYLLEGVLKDSQAWLAGLREGDIIVSCNGRPVTALDTIEKLISTAPSGSEVVVEYYRDGLLYKTTFKAQEKTGIFGRYIRPQKK